MVTHRPPPSMNGKDMKKDLWAHSQSQCDTKIEEKVNGDSQCSARQADLSHLGPYTTLLVKSRPQALKEYIPILFECIWVLVPYPPFIAAWNASHIPVPSHPCCRSVTG